MILKFFILFVAILCTLLFINIKLTITARAIAFHEYEPFGESKKAFGIMILTALAWTIYLTLY